MLFKYLIGALFIVGLILIAKPSHFYLKGYVAQKLLESTWEKSKDKKQIIYPWIGAKSYPIGKISIEKINISHIILGNFSSFKFAKAFFISSK